MFLEKHNIIEQTPEIMLKFDIGWRIKENQGFTHLVFFGSVFNALYASFEFGEKYVISY